MERTEIDTDTLERLLRVLEPLCDVLNEKGVTRFKGGGLELDLGGGSEPAAPAAGFMPPVIVTMPGEEKPGPQDARSLNYNRAFGGPPPSFLKAEPAKSGGD